VATCGGDLLLFVGHHEGPCRTSQGRKKQLAL
jgi:hypothetical protein